METSCQLNVSGTTFSVQVDGRVLPCQRVFIRYLICICTGWWGRANDTALRIYVLVKRTTIRTPYLASIHHTPGLWTRCCVRMYCRSCVMLIRNRRTRPPARLTAFVAHVLTHGTTWCQTEREQSPAPVAFSRGLLTYRCAKDQKMIEYSPNREVFYLTKENMNLFRTITQQSTVNASPYLGPASKVLDISPSRSTRAHRSITSRISARTPRILVVVG